LRTQHALLSMLATLFTAVILGHKMFILLAPENNIINVFLKFNLLLQTFSPKSSICGQGKELPFEFSCMTQPEKKEKFRGCLSGLVLFLVRKSNILNLRPVHICRLCLGVSNELGIIIFSACIN